MRHLSKAHVHYFEVQCKIPRAWMGKFHDKEGQYFSFASLEVHDWTWLYVIGYEGSYKMIKCNRLKKKYRPMYTQMCIKPLQ